MTGFLKKIGVSLAICLVLFLQLTGICFASEPERNTGGAKPASSGGTEVWGGVMVEDYLVTLRYEVTDEDGKPLAGVVIEHYDPNEGEYIYVGTTDANGIWESQVAMDYWTDGIIGQDENVTVMESDRDYWGNLRHRLTKDGYITIEGAAQVEVSRSEDGVLGLVRMMMKKVKDESSPSQPDDNSGSGSSEDDGRPHRPSKPDWGDKPHRPGQPKPPRPDEKLPGTGVGSIAFYLIAGSLLLLLAAVIIFKILREERKRARREESNGRDK